LLVSVGCGDDESDDSPAGDAGEHMQAGPDGSLPQGHDAGADGGTSDAGQVSGARIETRLRTPRLASGNKLRAGAASATGLSSLKYFVRSIQICESLTATGSGFSNPQNCLELYRGDQTLFPYMTTDDFSPLAEAARTHGDEGFIDLMDPGARAALGGATMLSEQHVRSYNYGIITWALPIKLTATVTMGDGTSLFTHDGATTYAELGTDRYRDYFTEATSSLGTGPAEQAVVLLPNGGNWFKFQSPLTISSEDIASSEAYVLDLVFNPDGIVQGFTDGPYGSVRNTGVTPRGITVPMLDLAPVPHRASDEVQRESYRGALSLDGNSFDVRLELYSIAGDASGTVFGVDVKSLVNAGTSMVPPSLAKIAFVERQADGTLSFFSGTHAPLITGLRPAAAVSDTSHVSIVCGVHADRLAAEGGAAVIVNTCPSPTLDVELTLEARTGLSAAP